MTSTAPLRRKSSLPVFEPAASTTWLAGCFTIGNPASLLSKAAASGMSEGMRASLSTGKELFDAAIARSSWTQVQLRRKANRSEPRRLLRGLKPSQAAGVAAGQLQGLAPLPRWSFGFCDEGDLMRHAR